MAENWRSRASGAEKDSRASGRLSVSSRVRTELGWTTDEYHLSGFRLQITVLGLCLSIILVALDNAILATAIPTITTRFNSLSDIGWYGSAYLITTCAFQPLSGKAFQYFSLKWTYLCFLGFFELGSLICGLAPSSLVLILGRAVAGVGSAGLFSGGMIIVANTIPLRIRPSYTGIIMSMFGLAGIVGPLLGGALTEHVSWRWCFFINLPCGAITAAILICFFHPPRRESANVPLKEKIANLDIPGLLLFASAIAMLLFAFQWAGTIYPWKSATIIGLFCGFGCMAGLFVYRQIQAQDRASIPPRIFMERTVLSSSIVTFLLMGCLQVVVYYLPLWFQVVKGSSPMHNGIQLLPTVLANVVSSILVGILVTRLGYLNFWVFIGVTAATIGVAMFSTVEIGTLHPEWIGYEVLCGFGIGVALQVPFIAVQAVLPLETVSSGTSIVVFFQFFGGAIFLAVAQSIFEPGLMRSLAINAPQVDAVAIVKAGATAVRHLVPPDRLHGVLFAYNEAITEVYYAATAVTALAFLAAFGIKWINLKGRNRIGGGA